MSDVYTRNVRLYSWYTAFNEPLFWGPILVSALMRLGHMTVSEINYMEATVLIVCALADIPGGILADRLGRRWTIILGRIFLLASYLFFAFMSTSIHAWTGNILWAIGFSLQSGADSSILKESLRVIGKGHLYKQYEGRAVSIRFMLMLVCALPTGVLAEYDLRLPLIVGMPFVAIPLVSAYFFTETTPSIESISSVRQSVKDLPFKQLAWVLLFSAVLSTSSKVWFFNYNPYFESIGIRYWEFGVIFMLLNLVAGLASRYAHRIEHVLGESASVIVMILCVAIPIMLMGLCPIHACAYTVLMQNVTRGMMQPLVGEYVHARVPDSMRATAQSTISTGRNVVSIAALYAYGYLLSYTGMYHALVILGGITLGVGIVLYIVYVTVIAHKQ